MGLQIRRRVVITGLGLVTPLGMDVDRTWKNILNSRSGIKRIDRFDVDNFLSKIAGLADYTKDSGFNIDNYISPRELKKIDLFIQYGIIAAEEALKDSEIDLSDERIKSRTGVSVGSGIGGLYNIEITSVKFHTDKQKVSPFFIPATLINLLSGHISIRHKLTGPNLSVTTACATGAHSIGEAVRLIKYGDADIMIAGGAEAAITPLAVAGFNACKALSTKFNDSPEQASRPWDRDRDGFVMSEGAGIVVLEEYEHAKKRGAKIYAEVIGYGLSADGYHITSPHPEGIGGIKAMKQALIDAEINPKEVDYINAHSTSTLMGDEIELNSIQEIFLDDNPKVLVSSTKSSIGHSLGAAGSIELIFCALAIRDQVVPPTLNLDNPIPEARVDLVPHIAKDARVNCVLTNSFGFGNTNASLIIRKL